MADQRTHLNFGVPIGAGYGLVRSEGQPPLARALETLGGAWGAQWGARCPDWIDVPTNSYYRSIAHGIVPAIGFGGWAMKNLQAAQDQLRGWADGHAAARLLATTPAMELWHACCEALLRFLAGALAGFIAGYASHLALDLFTPRSLPLLC